MCAYVIGVVRGAAGLDALVYKPSAPPDRATPWKVQHACVLRPLSPSARPELWTAWRALEAVTEWDEDTLNHVLTILRETVPCSDGGGDLVSLGPEVHAPPPPRATAAHPRAYRGTRHRPPRPEQPDAVDVRPYLLARRHIDQVLELLGQGRGIDPYVAWHFRVDATASFDPVFVMHLLPLLRDCTWSDVGAFAALARTLELHRQPELRAALVAVFLAAADPARALAWWSHVLAHDPVHRLEAAELVSATEVAKIDPVTPDVASVIADLVPVQQWSIYRALARGASPTYLFSGLELQAISSAVIGELAPGQLDATEIITSTVDRLATAMKEDSGAEFWRSNLWHVCGHQPELVELLSHPTFGSLEPSAAFWLLRLGCSPRWSPETAEREWEALGPRLPVLAELTAECPLAYQRKFIEDIVEAYWSAAGDEKDVRYALAGVVDLCKRVAKPPFGTESVLGPVMACLALIKFDDWDDLKPLRAAPDASWLALEQACERLNDARIIGRGLYRVAQLVPELLSVFATSPSALFRTADTLTTLSMESVEDVIASYKASAIAAASVVDASIERLCELVEPIARAGGPDPVRRALRRHLAGEVMLSEAQLSGHRARIVADLDLVRLAAIRQAVEGVLARRVGMERLDSSTARHAVAMLGGVEKQGRQFRRMLAANFAGDTGWRLRHPRTREWFARHPRLDQAKWLAGIERTGELAGIGTVRLAIETDPLEALKLGTYVGSCLGRGGNLEYSAAAVVLDVNKLVVYARDPRGSVVGRQLLALSEADELVCFSVYGTAKVELLEPLFRDFDHAFAAELGLPLFGDPSDMTTDYEISSILSHEWWDDSAWREVVETSAR